MRGAGNSRARAAIAAYIGSKRRLKPKGFAQARWDSLCREMLAAEERREAGRQITFR
jgi:hypothetical protein